MEKNNKNQKNQKQLVDNDQYEIDNERQEEQNEDQNRGINYQEQGQYNFADPIGEQEQFNDEEIQEEYEDIQNEYVVNAAPNHNRFSGKVPNIPMDDAPFVVLVGPPQSGKSMVLKCLGDYVYNHEELHYTIEADNTLFADKDYEADCQEFNDLIGDNEHIMPNTINYLMANISDQNGNVKAHFLEAPGEHFFSIEHFAEEPNRKFQSYMDKIAKIGTGKNRKVVYIIILDLDSPTSFRRIPKLRAKYQEKMIKLYNRYVVNHPAQVILLYNKADIPQHEKWANAAGVVNLQAILDDARRQYPALFFTRKFLWWNVENFTFLPFCTGSYDGQDYTTPAASYPESLWKAITKIW